MSLGVDDTKLNRKLADAKIRQIELDILSDNFDFTLAKYKAQTYLTVVENVNSKQQVKLSDVWAKHRAFKEPNRSQSWVMTCNQQTKYLAKCLYKSLGESKEIFNWITANIPAHSAKRLVVEISACCDWGIKNNLITINPFKGLAKEINIKKISTEDNDINPFSKYERDAIVVAFRDNSYYKHYAN